ncbi:MAG: hypothetical protein AABZ14_04355, partial [Candidatus Margulisiibacteriota bacterium]
MLQRRQAQLSLEVAQSLQHNVAALEQVKRRLMQEIQVLILEREKLRDEVLPSKTTHSHFQQFLHILWLTYSRAFDQVIRLWRG